MDTGDYPAVTGDYLAKRLPARRRSLHDFSMAAVKKKTAKKRSAPAASRSRDERAKTARPARSSTAAAAKREDKSSRARAEYARLLREINDAELDAQRGWDRLWEASRIVVRKRYYLLDEEHPTAADWILAHTGELYRTAQRNMTVAALSSPDEQREYKVTRIGLAYAIDEAQQSLNAKKKKVDYTPPETPAKLDLAKLRYEVERDGATLELGLGDVSTDELRAILRGLRRGSKRDDSRLGPTAARLVAKIAGDKSLDNVRVIERGGEISLSGVRADQLGALGALLSAISRDRS